MPLLFCHKMDPLLWGSVVFEILHKKIVLEPSDIGDEEVTECEQDKYLSRKLHDWLPRIVISYGKAVFSRLEELI